jgi:uncharacterized RDD family membrane protein YckC
MGQQVGANGPSGPRAGFWQRFAAYIIDSIIIAIPFVILLVALKAVGYAFGILIEIAYFTYFFGGPDGQTPGMKVMGIRVLDFSGAGGPIGYGRGFIRFIGLIVSGLVIYIGFLWMLWDKEKQCWQDKFANTVVVPVSAYPPLT